MLPRSRLVPEVLAEYGAMVRTALARYLPQAEPRRYLYDLVADYPRRGGRALRPSLCIATARAFGGRMEHALATAASIELLHNALLVHDDIEDESHERRGKPTLHQEWGVPLALNAGDMLLLLGLQPLMDNRYVLGPQLTMRLFEETERMGRESAEGQALELGWRRDNVVQVSESDYLLMVLKKTCWLTTIHPTRAGVLIGTGSAGVNLEPFIRFGFLLGAAFQIQDDVLNLIGEAKSYGKELNGDIHEGKRTLMIIRLLERADGDERRRVVELFSLPREQRLEEHTRWVRERMDSYGCIDYAREVASGLAGAALAEFETTYGPLPPSRDKDFIQQLVTWVIERT